MPNPHSLPSPWPVSLIIITTLSGVIIGALIAYLVYFITARKKRFFKNIPAKQDTQVSPEKFQVNPRAEVEGDRVQLGLDTARRLPLLEINENFVESVYPSVYNDRLSGSNPSSDHSNESRTLMASEAGHKIFPTDLKTLTEKSGGNEAQEQAPIGDKSLSCKIAQNVSSEAAVVIQLRPGLAGNKYDLPSPPEMSREETEASLYSAGSSGGFDLTMANERAMQSLEKFPEFRVVPSAIVETTEKKTTTQVLRKRLLSLVSSPSNPRLGNLSDKKEVKYYWEMMQVESNDTWWQLPFPPQFSPIEPNFEILESGN